MKSGVQVLFNFGVKSGMPRYTVLLGLLQGSTLLIPESVWTTLGVNLLPYLTAFPAFVQHYVDNSDFKNSMLLFWLLSPFTLFVNTSLYFVHLNFRSYTSYLCRRQLRLANQRKQFDYSLIIGASLLLLAYFWSNWYTGISLRQPTILGISLTKNLIAMLLVHGLAIGLICPMALAVLVTELRVNISELPIFRR